jgi:hypothetical protein
MYLSAFVFGTNITDGLSNYLAGFVNYLVLKLTTTDQPRSIIFKIGVSWQC